MGWNKITIRPADRAFSNYIRAKRNWTCEYCGKKGKINGIDVARIEASHYWSRRNESTRFDEINVRVLCSSCHRELGGHTKLENGPYDIWMKEKLGEQEYKLLKIRANTYKKKDDALVILTLKQLMK